VARAIDPELYEQPYATCPMQHFCDVSADGVGLSVAAAGIYEYECTDNAARALALTLLRSTDCIDLGGFDTPRYRMNRALMMDTPITYTLSLIPHGADLTPVYDMVNAALLPPLTTLNRQSEISVMTDFVQPARDLPTEGNAVKIEGMENVEITAVKRGFSRETLIVRLHNRGAEKATGTLKVSTAHKTPSAAYETTLGEDRVRPLSLTDGTVAFDLRPSGLLTLEFEMSNR
jgi:alpha-mannosidase